MDVNVSERLTFYWKAYTEPNDYLEFYIDNELQDRISNQMAWQRKSYIISGSGSHTLKWRYVKDDDGDGGDDRGIVDFIQWSGSPALDPNNWSKITYKYDSGGRRIEKNVDGRITRYCYDGGHVIAEYDGTHGTSTLLRKYIYGPGVDEPICMIEVADGNAVYYYHYDALKK